MPINNHPPSASYTQRDGAGQSASMSSLGKFMGMFKAPDPNLPVDEPDCSAPQKKLQLAREMLFTLGIADNGVKEEAHKDDALKRGEPLKKEEDREPNGAVVQRNVSRTLAERVMAERTTIV